MALQRQNIILRSAVNVFWRRIPVKKQGIAGRTFFSNSGLKKAKKTHSRWLKKIVIILSISHFATSIAILCQRTRMSFQSCSSFSFSFFLTLPLIASLIQTVLQNYSPKQTVALSGYPTAKKLERPVSSATSVSMPPDVLSKICFKFRAL